MRVLIATVTAGAGHLAAAAALEEAWSALRPKDTLQRVDVLDYTPRFFRKAYSQGYVKLVEHAPELYAAVFRRTDNARLVRRLSQVRRTLSLLPGRKFITFLRRFKPDVVLCPHFLPLEILGHLQSQGRNWKPPYTVCIVTDFEAHALWMEPSVDLYCVAAEETGVRLVARGVAPEAVVATGIPVAAKFSQPPAPHVARRQLGLRDDLPVLLALSGGFGMGPVAKILGALDQTGCEIQIVVVCGRNQTLRRELAARDRRHPTHVLGFVDNMHELMAASAVILTKPGGLTSSEALALGKPMVILDPIPGQETANADFLLERGAAIKLNSVDDLPFRLHRLLGSKKLAAMAEAARALGRPGAARAVCAEVLRRMPEV